MNISESKSEVARLLQQITQEYEAAQRGLCGLAQGTAQHAFINERLENMSRYHDTLKGVVGEQAATQMLVEVWEQTGA